eukprot:m.495286 g.495286  ORF g.495286 m.495286 type:complete len:91 (+) comp57298_c0_seq8:249-521(+)
MHRFWLEVAQLFEGLAAPEADKNLKGTAKRCHSSGSEQGLGLAHSQRFDVKACVIDDLTSLSGARVPHMNSLIQASGDYQPVAQGKEATR